MTDSLIFLYGPPGSGKSTIGSILAKNLKIPFHDLDVDIENTSGCSVAQIFVEQGESGFRALEHQVIEPLLCLGTGVIALGGGSLTIPAVRALVEAKGSVVCLHTVPEILLTRLQPDHEKRPLLAGNAAEKLADLLAQRGEHYASFPVQLDTTQLDPTQAAWEVQILLGRFHLKNSNHPYDVYIQSGGLDSLGQELSGRDLHGPLAIVADSNTAPLYARRVAASLDQAGFSHSLLVIPAGESSKTLVSAQKLWENFLDAGLERDSTVIALGGGVVGDLAGFAASTYMRGIQWVDVPTTLLAMVDSSLGGKTGVDTPRGKNLVGAFHPPSFVLVDPELLVTLPGVEFRSGLAEVVKHGIIADPGLLKLCSAFKSPHGQALPAYGDPSDWDGRELARLVSRAMAVKVGIIESDPYERGERAALNLGHTIGHALEQVSGFSLRHGEAVAIGMVVEARLAERLGLAKTGLSRQIAALLAKLGLPTEIPGNLERTAIRTAIRVDKKKNQGIVRFALPTRIGNVRIGVDVPVDVLVSEI